MENKGTLEERFKKNYVVDSESGCWIWTGSTMGQMHYGALWLGHKYIAAHRLAWQLFKGEIPKGKSVLHRCDTPLCVNPGHLFTGTQNDNVQDCINKGRMNKEKKIGQREKMFNRINRF
jgi:hypothetical protein